ncbi:MAG: cobalamin-dependent protein [Candidatus Omnitrophota bacterium]
MAKRDLPLVVFLISDLSLAGEPHGIMQLAAHARLNNWDFSVVTLREDFISIIEKLKPRLIAASVMSSDIRFFFSAFEKIKNKFPEIPLIMGGPHATFVSDSINTMSVDALVVGEGDYAFVEILGRISHGNNFSDIDNVVLKGSAFRLGQLVADLDSLPDLERKFVYNHYNRLLGEFKLKSFFSSRGCPYQCTYCFNHAYNKLYRGKGEILRKRSVDRIIEEVLRVKQEYPMEYIRFSDDVFVLCADSWLDEFRKKFRKKVNIPFYCLISANTINEDVVKSLKEAG